MIVLAWLGILAAAVTVLGGAISFLRLLWRALRAIVRMSDAMPTLLSIADEFKPNGGKSLHDRLERLELGQRALLMDHGYATPNDYPGEQ